MRLCVVWKYVFIPFIPFLKMLSGIFYSIAVLTYRCISDVVPIVYFMIKQIRKHHKFIVYFMRGRIKNSEEEDHESGL